MALVIIIILLAIIAARCLSFLGPGENDGRFESERHRAQFAQFAHQRNLGPSGCITRLRRSLRMPHSFTLVAALTGIACAASAYATDLSGPDPQLTPGAVVSNDRDTACAFRDTPRLYQTDRSAYYEQAKRVFAAYGVPYAQHQEFELDHLTPRCIGGADDDRNLWPEPLVEARIKDDAERSICIAVCTEHTMSLEEGQRYFTSGQWRNQR